MNSLMTQKTRYRILFGIALACLPASMVTALILLNAVNPMAMAFLTAFEVENQSGTKVFVTPVGAVGPQGDRRTLPLNATEILSIPAWKDREFVLNPGQRKKFVYDWDDINFSEILVVPVGGQALEVVVDAQPTVRQYRRVSTNSFTIPALASLPVAKPATLAAMDKPSRMRVMWPLAALGAAAVAMLVYSRRKLRQIGAGDPL